MKQLCSVTFLRWLDISRNSFLITLCLYIVVHTLVCLFSSKKSSLSSPSLSLLQTSGIPVSYPNRKRGKPNLEPASRIHGKLDVSCSFRPYVFYLGVSYPLNTCVSTQSIQLCFCLSNE